MRWHISRWVVTMGIRIKCGSRVTQLGGAGNGWIGLHVLRMEFAWRDFHSHSWPHAEHQSFPKFDCSLSLPTNRFQMSRCWPLLCFSFSCCSAASKLWMFWNPGSVSHCSCGRSGKVHALLKIFKRWCLNGLIDWPQRQQKTPGGRSGKVHTLLKILKRWCLISLVERPQRQQKTPPEGINLRICPRLTIGCSLLSVESGLTVGWGCGRSDSPYHCWMCVCQMVIKHILDDVKVRPGNDHIRWDDSCE